jgi:hypothetical protein
MMPTRTEFLVDPVRLKDLTIGSSDRGGRVFGEPRSGSMIEMNKLRFPTAQPRVAQPHR